MASITDGGMETCLIFDHGLDLPHFAAFVLLDADGGPDLLSGYFEPYLALARDHGAGFVLDTPTWRANPDWGERIGYSAAALDSVNRRGVELSREIAGGQEGVVVTGVVGPRGDGYRADAVMDEADAERYHTTQVESLAAAGVDAVAGVTLTYAAEAVGIVRAARAAELPVKISFTVETDGALPDGSALGEAIGRVDAATDGAASGFMVNCAHPSHMVRGIEPGAAWTERVAGVRANASRRSHAELDEADELDSGNPRELAVELAALRGVLPALTVFGGCCGTDVRHIAAICETCLG